MKCLYDPLHQLSTENQVLLCPPGPLAECFSPQGAGEKVGARTGKSRYRHVCEGPSWTERMSHSPQCPQEGLSWVLEASSEQLWLVPALVFRHLWELPLLPWSAPSLYHPLPAACPKGPKGDRPPLKVRSCWPCPVPLSFWSQIPSSKDM